MAYLAVDKDGTETIFGEKPRRCIDEGYWLAKTQNSPEIALIKGSIQKLIGKTLNWKDEPYLFVEVTRNTRYDDIKKIDKIVEKCSHGSCVFANDNSTLYENLLDIFDCEEAKIDIEKEFNVNFGDIDLGIFSPLQILEMINSIKYK